MVHCFDINDQFLVKYWRQYVFSQELQPTFDRFISEVWNQGLSQVIRDSTMKGMSGKFGNVTLRSWCGIGRIMITFESEEDQITYICAEDEGERDPGSTFGIQSVYGNIFSARSILETVIQLWKRDGVNYKDDNKVNVG